MSQVLHADDNVAGAADLPDPRRAPSMATTPTREDSNEAERGRAVTSFGELRDAAEILDLISERVVRYRLPDLTITYCNAAWAELFRLDRDVAIGRSLDDFLSENGREGLRRQLALLGPACPTATDVEARSSLFDPELWLQWSDSFVDTPSGPEIVSVGRDVTEIHNLQERLTELATSDPLTGLANRRSFTERLDAALAADAEHGAPVTVVYADLDGLKRVNDTYGHAAGDRVLIGTAERLVAAVGELGTVARIGGDEFGVVVDDDGGCDDIVDRIERSLLEPIDLGNGRSVVPRASIGAATARPSSRDAGQLVAAADDAMYRVKRMRRGDGAG